MPLETVDAPAAGHAWPALPYGEWKGTCATLHMWAQIVGKIRLAQTPWTNHAWHVPLYVTARGLGTSPIPWQDRVFDLDFDFIDHVLRISMSDGRTRNVALKPRSVMDFHRELFEQLGELGVQIRIHGRPNEALVPIPFDKDVQPPEARYEAALGEFVLPYDGVRASSSPDAMLLAFLQSTYEAAAGLAHWDRQALERGSDWRALPAKA